ncbi:MAG TPA: response regulator transcription factor [Chloroflexota bacterium]|nr:response regulator transcription factor [Chloroflexota bacterium]
MQALISDRSAESDDSSNAQPLVLVVGDDTRLLSFLDRQLSAVGYRVELASDGQKALAAAAARAPRVVILDVALPGPHGLDVARRLRDHSGVPILMLATAHETDARVAGLDAGADDYLPKPFALEELLARLRALLRGRALAAADALADSRHVLLTYADVCLDQDTREATRGGRRLDLRNKAFVLLACFLRHPGRVLSRRELLGEVWGYEFLGDSNVIEVTVGHVRQALEAVGEPRLIHTVRPIGYILRTDNGSAQRPFRELSPP